MIQEQDIKVINHINTLLPTFKTSILPELLKDKLEQIIPKEIINEKNDRFICNMKLIENFIIIISAKTALNLSEVNSIKILGFEVSIIKLDFSQEDKKSEINISIPLKEPKIFTIKNFTVQKYFFSDFIKISEEKNYFHICVFDQLHIFKIYTKDNQLKYNKIELKKFSEKSKVLYLGEYHNKKENILEIDLLLKPMNNIMILEINTDEKSQKVEEKIYEFKNMKNTNKNIFHKYLRSFCGKFLFTEKETDKKYLIYRDKDDITIKSISMDNIDNNLTNGNNIHFLYTYENVLYLLTELSKENDVDECFLNLGIFNLYYNEEKDIYETKLTQKIMIKNEAGNKNYSISTNIDKDISIQTGDNIIYLQLGKNSSVEKIFKLNTNAKQLQISKLFFAKFNHWFIILSLLGETIYISKINIEDTNYIENNCIINCEEKLMNKDDNLIQEQNMKNEDINNNQIMKGEKSEDNNNENYSSQKLDEILVTHLNDFIDKTIKERIEQNNSKLDSIKQEYGKKFELIEQDILAQKKENEILEKRLNEILNKICELNGNNSDHKDSINIDSNSIDNDINNLKNINEMFKTKNSFPQNDKMNNFLPFMNRMNTMRMMNPFNFLRTENMFNNPMMMNDPRITQLLANSFMNQGNSFFPKKNK